MLLEAGCTDAEVSAITGQTREMVVHYARAVNQRKLAAAAILKWEALEQAAHVRARRKSLGESSRGRQGRVKMRAYSRTLSPGRRNIAIMTGVSLPVLLKRPLKSAEVVVSDTFEQQPFDPGPFISNPSQRCPCVLLLDVSGSMRGKPIEELNAGVAV